MAVHIASDRANRARNQAGANRAEDAAKGTMLTTTRPAHDEETTDGGSCHSDAEVSTSSAGIATEAQVSASASQGIFPCDGSVPGQPDNGAKVLCGKGKHDRNARGTAIGRAKAEKARAKQGGEVSKLRNALREKGNTVIAQLFAPREEPRQQPMSVPLPFWLSRECLQEPIMSRVQIPLAEVVRPPPGLPGSRCPVWDDTGAPATEGLGGEPSLEACLPADLIEDIGLSWNPWGYPNYAGQMGLLH